jgi:acetoacetate decarboxylase
MALAHPEAKTRRGIAIRHYETLRSVVGAYALGTSGSETRFRFGRQLVTRGFARYHRAKALDPTLHNGSWGGKRRSLFNDHDQVIAELLLWNEVLAEPCRSINDYVHLVNHDYGVPITLRWTASVFKRWKLTIKKAQYRVIEKYFAVNILYYWYIFHPHSLLLYPLLDIIVYSSLLWLLFLVIN